MIPKIEELKKEFEARLNTYIAELPADNLHSPAKYILALGGKRLRPVLVLMSAFAYGEIQKSAFHGALAVEIFHNFSLVHDDIMDEAPLRRGEQTVHTKWDTNTAILSGDAMLIEAYKELSLAGENEYLSQLLDLFNTTSLEVCRGQQLDMDFESMTDVDADQYIEMIGLKTAVLLGCALKMGAIISGASKDDAQALYNFGKWAGIGFQIQDDYLDAFGDPEKFGKQVGGDIISNKKTYLIIKALERASGETEKDLSDIYFKSSIDSKSEKVKRVQEIFRDLEVDKETLDASKYYFQKANEAIAQLSLPSDKKELFKDFLNSLETRNY